MSRNRNQIGTPWGALARCARFFAARDGAVSPLMTLLLIPIIGALGLGAEVSSWYFTQRSMQNAADTAALAAATNGCTTGTCGVTYDQEAAAAAKQYGFVNGSNNATVATTYPVACPSGATNCYKVTITQKLPIYLARIVGFAGDTTVGTSQAQTVTASAVASPKGLGLGYCLIALANTVGSTTNAITFNGGGSINLGGCDIYSNASMKCNGANSSNNYYGVGNGDSVGAVGSNPCGQPGAQNGGLAALPDTFAALSTAANIPSTGCVAAPVGGLGATLDLSTGDKCYSGDVTVNTVTNVTTASSGSVLRIYNGNLVMNAGGKLSGSNLTIVFTGPGGNNSPGFVTGSSGNPTPVLDIGNPKSGTWSGIALYQDARMTKPSSQTYSGSKLTFNITGLIYMPYANFTIQGAINHQTGGLACIGIIADQVTVGGGGWIFDNPTSQCNQDGLTLPTVAGTEARQALVQ